MTAKFLHLLGLVVGLGFGLANVILMVRSASVAREARPTLAGLQKLNGRIALGGVIVLWVTGLWLYYGKHASAGLGGLFHAKLGVAAILTVLALYAQWLIWRAGQAGEPPPAGVMRAIGLTVPALALVTAWLAMLVFG